VEFVEGAVTGDTGAELLLEIVRSHQICLPRAKVYFKS
jgi:hypothetical protein